MDEEKKRFRAKALARRDSLTAQWRRDYSDRIIKKLTSLPCYQDADAVLTYVSFRSEVDTISLMEQAFADGKAVFAPKVLGKEMDFFRIYSLADLTEGYRGILEPSGGQLIDSWIDDRLGQREKFRTGKPLNTKAADESAFGASSILVCLPGTAFDRAGHRIGYGGGFYDRFLSGFLEKESGTDAAAHPQMKFTTVALSFSCQIFETIPCEAHDICPMCVITEKEIFESFHWKGKHMMESIGTTEIDEYLTQLGTKAQTAKTVLHGLDTAQKNHALTQAADALVRESESILAANDKDCVRAKENGMAEGLIDRLKLTPARIEAMAEGLRQIAALPDPVGEVMESFDRPNGLHIEKVRVPMGVTGIIYEARPNVTADAFGLCFKTGNAVILKGGRDASFSNQAITETIREALKQEGIDKNAVQLIENNDRAVTTAFMRLKEYVDVLIPRGGAGLIRSVVENSTIPVIETGTGNCHIYIDESADLTKVIPIVINAKTQRIGVCNACESLLVHEKIAEQILPALGKALLEKQVEIRGDETVLTQIPEAQAVTEADYGTEYLDLILSVKTVASLEEAIAHINKYNTGHSDAILTEDQAHAQKFLREVDSACVYVNASTRFTDGFEFGFGAEIGISTQKLHARGPMGLKELTSYKYQITGNGQIRP